MLRKLKQSIHVYSFLFWILLCSKVFANHEPSYGDSPSQSGQFDCIYECGRWGTEQIRDIEWQFIEALWLFYEIEQVHYLKTRAEPYPYVDASWLEELKGDGVSTQECRNNFTTTWSAQFFNDNEEHTGKVFSHFMFDRKSLPHNSPEYIEAHSDQSKDKDSYLFSNYIDLSNACDVVDREAEFLYYWFPQREMREYKEWIEDIAEEFGTDNLESQILLNYFEIFGETAIDVDHVHEVCLRERWSVRSQLLEHTLKMIHEDYLKSCYKEKIVEFKERLKAIQSDHHTLQDRLEGVKKSFRKIHLDCARLHSSPNSLYNSALIYLLEGDYNRALENMKELCKAVDLRELERNLISKISMSQGKAELEIGKYDKAILSLTKAIQLDSNNKEAYFERALAYFETGEFEKATADFSSSGIKSKSANYHIRDNLEFSTGFIQGTLSGSVECLSDFGPHMMSSLHGLAHGLWAFSIAPKEVSSELLEAAQNMVEFISSHSALELAQFVVPELRELIEKKDDLSSYERGELIGTIIGRYGTDFLLFAGVSKGMKAYKDLRNANTAFTLERMLSTEARAEIIAASTKWVDPNITKAKDIKESGGRIDNDLYKAFRNETLSELEVRKILHAAEFETFPRPEGIPAHWHVSITQRSGGMKFTNPENLHNNIRIMPGNPTSDLPAQRIPYVIHLQDGKAFDKLGNLVDSKTREAHIPLQEFIYRFKNE